MKTRDGQTMLMLQDGYTASFKVEGDKIKIHYCHPVVLTIDHCVSFTLYKNGTMTKVGS